MKKTILKLTVIPVLIALVCPGCDSGKEKDIFFKDLSGITYTINDSILSMNDNGKAISLNFVIFDSAWIKEPNEKMFTIGIASFSNETAQHIKEIAALAIGKKLGASEIRIVKDKAAYTAHITSDLSGKGGEEVMKLLEESWEFDFILK